MYSCFVSCMSSSFSAPRADPTMQTYVMMCDTIRSGIVVLKQMLATLKLLNNVDIGRLSDILYPSLNFSNTTYMEGCRFDFLHDNLLKISSTFRCIFKLI